MSKDLQDYALTLLKDILVLRYTKPMNEVWESQWELGTQILAAPLKIPLLDYEREQISGCVYAGITGCDCSLCRISTPALIPQQQSCGRTGCTSLPRTLGSYAGS